MFYVILIVYYTNSESPAVGLKGGGTISAHYQSFISIIQGEKFKNIGICHFLFFFYVWFWRVIFFFIHNKNKKLFFMIGNDGGAFNKSFHDFVVVICDNNFIISF